MAAVGAPRLSTDNAALRATLDRSLRDLGELRIFDPDVPDQVTVAAGAPWFMAVFGRDSLITSYMALALDPGLALGALQTLARHQGVRTDPVSEEQPGRIPHELRFGVEASLVLGGNVYYGTADATPLFVDLLGELHRWGLFPDEVSRLLPHANRALEWIDVYGDRDGDGFVEYQRSTDRGLFNQGWKDSGDGITFADGRIAQPPIALCEVQGYVYAAYLARALLAEDLGPAGGCDVLAGPGCATQARVQRAVLAARPGLVRARAGSGQTADRLACLEYGPLLVVGDR